LNKAFFIIQCCRSRLDGYSSVSLAKPIKKRDAGFFKTHVHLENYPPVASLMHFFKKLFFAAPASFLSLACASQLAVAAVNAAEASFSHFWTKLVLAAPTSFFSAACASQVAAKDEALKVKSATDNKAVRFFISIPNVNFKSKK
jgi:hypothetical protein